MSEMMLIRCPELSIKTVIIRRGCVVTFISQTTGNKNPSAEPTSASAEPDTFNVIMKLADYHLENIGKGKKTHVSAGKTHVHWLVEHNIWSCLLRQYTLSCMALHIESVRMCEWIRQVCRNSTVSTLSTVRVHTGRSSKDRASCTTVYWTSLSSYCVNINQQDGEKHLTPQQAQWFSNKQQTHPQQNGQEEQDWASGQWRSISTHSPCTTEGTSRFTTNGVGEVEVGIRGPIKAKERKLNLPCSLRWSHLGMQDQNG